MARIFFATTIIACFVIAALLMYDGLQPKQESPAPVQETAVAEVSEVSPPVSLENLNYCPNEECVYMGEKYDWMGVPVRGIMRVKQNGQMFHIYEDGTPLYPQTYDRVSVFTHNLADVEKDGKKSHIFRDGTLLHDFYGEDDYFEDYFNEYEIKAQLKFEAGYIRCSLPGCVCSGEVFDWIGAFVNGRALVRQNGQMFHIYPDCRRPYEQTYDWIYPSYDGVMKAGKDKSVLFIVEEDSIFGSNEEED